MRYALKQNYGYSIHIKTSYDWQRITLFTSDSRKVAAQALFSFTAKNVEFFYEKEYRFRIFIVFARKPIDTGFREVSRKNWSRQEINRKRVIQVIRVILRILLLPWIQWVMIRVIERYATNGFFSVEISWIPLITDPSVQTNRPLMAIIWILR